ncbi:MAG: outer membrane beta-barrel domain-containing protein [Myxococcota bacterium]|nr:outer membrane beta-barrel domain-containing protein [Myxococcota bacterium]
MLFVSSVQFVAFDVEGANIQGPKRTALEKLQSGDAVRNRFMLRSDRFEVAPTLGFTLNDAFRRNMLLGVDFDFNWSDSWAVGAALQYGLGMDSALKERLEAERPDRVSQGGFAELKLAAAVEVTYTPIFGKLAFLGRKVFDYDTHLIAGAGLVSVSGNPEVEELSPMLVGGVGIRFFMNRSSAILLQFKNQLFSYALNAVDGGSSGGDGAKSGAASEWRNTLSVTIGYSFFFPTQPKVSN